MIRKYHNHTPQTNPQHREKEPQNTKSHKTYMERYEHDTDLTRSWNTIKTAALWIMYMGIVEIYLLFNRSCTIYGLKPRGGGEYPICDIVRMCMPNSPHFQRPQVYDKPPFLKKKVYDCPDFWYWNGPNFLTPMYMHIFFAQIPVKPLFSHLHKAGFLMMRVICKLFTNHRGYKKYINSKNSL